jgi:DNA-binding NtrC family response regulator
VNDSRWDDDGTRPLAGRTLYRLPAFTLQVEGTGIRRFVTQTVTLGSSPENDFVVAGETVSRFHAHVVRLGDAYAVRDLDSTNGTWVNGVRVREAFLVPGCVLDLGGTKVRFEAGEEVLNLEPSSLERMDGLVGKSPAMRQLYHLVEQVARTDATVLIEGETGTGKEVLARVLHDRSHRADSPFVVVDCASIPANLLESELFGHEKGSFSGALTGRKGLFEMAHGGTVFLDEIGELPQDLQPRLLRVVQAREVRRVGSNRPIPLDIRVVAATNRNLQAEVSEGRFRADLFFRLAVVPVYLPPLRERREDIPLLVEHILASRCPGKSLSGTFAQSLARYPFPGNVRELVNLVERAIALGEETAVRGLGAEMPPPLGAGPLAPPPGWGASGAEMPPPLGAGPLAPPPGWGASGAEMPPPLGAGPLAPPPRGAAAVPTTDLPQRLRPPPSGEARRGDLASALRPPPSGEARRGDLASQPFKQAKDLAVAEFEESYLAGLMERCGGNISAASRLADVDRKHLRQLLRKYGLYYSDDGV